MSKTRRTFLKKLTALGAGALVIPAWDAGFARDLNQAFDSLHQKNPLEAATSEAEWKTVRESFLYPTDFINLENGYHSPQPKPVLEFFLAETQRINTRTSHYMRTRLYEDWENVRAELGKFSGLHSESIALTRNTTESLDILISGMDLKSGEEVIVTEYDYGSMIEAFHQQEARYGIKVNTIKIPIVPNSDQEMIDAFERAITEKTRVMLVTHLINLNGQVLPVKELCTLGKKHNIEVIVDGAHSFAHLDFQVSDLGCDYFGTSLHKWLCAPVGNGMLHVNRDKIENIWPLMGDTGRKKNDIRKFEHQGTRPPASYLSILKAIEFHNQIGTERKTSRLNYLKEYWATRVNDLPKVHLNTSLQPGHSCAIANVRVDGMTPPELATYLMEKHNIFTVAIERGDLQGVRVTPHLYNSVEDVEALVRALEGIG